jgi:hypothetical protein
VIEQEYSRPCRFFRGQKLATNIVWRFARPGAALLGFRSAFIPYESPPGTRDTGQVGEIAGTFRRYKKGPLLARPVPPGIAPDGTEEQFRGLAAPPASVLVLGGALPDPVCGAGAAIGLGGGQQQPVQSDYVSTTVQYSAEVAEV